MVNQGERETRLISVCGIEIDPKDIWRIGERQTIERIKNHDRTNYFTKLVKAIKTVGREALGPKIIALAEYKGTLRDGERVIIDNIIESYSSLQQAYNERLITSEDIASGVERIGIVRHNSGLLDVTHILPAVINIPGEREKHELTDDQRIPIEKAVFTERAESNNQIVEVERNKRIWGLLANFFQLKKGLESINTFEDFQRAFEGNKIIIPLNFISKEYYFRVEEPSISISSGKRPSGHINIQAASLFIKDDHGSKIILVYFIGKRWDNSTWSFIKENLVKQIANSIATARTIERANLQHPFSGGRADGN
jgi:hypothetical protein